MGFLKALRRKTGWGLLANSPIEDSSAVENLLSSDDNLSQKKSHGRASNLKDMAHSSARFKLPMNIGWIYLTIANLTLLIITVASNSIIRPGTGTNACLKETSFYSPILETITTKTHDVQLNGTLWPTEDMSWSRRDPGDPVGEQMWQSFEVVPTFPITKAQILALRKDPKTKARYSDSHWGMGDNAFIASLDVQHKMHCLNELRKMAFADYGNDAPTKTIHGQLWWLHLRHCTDMLAQDMLCHADADLVTYSWMDTQAHPFPDFSINRRCRSVDDLTTYRDKHSVDMEKYMAMPKPIDANQIPNEPGYYAKYGFAGSDLFPNGAGHPPLPNPTWFGYKGE